MTSWHRFFAPIPAHPHPAIYYGKLALGILLVVAVLAALQFAPHRWRKGIIAFFTFVGGLYYFLEFFLPARGTPPHNFLTGYQDFVGNLFNVIGSFGVGIGVISLMHVHSRNIARQRAGWGNSLALIVAFIAMLVFGLLNAYKPRLTIIPAVPSLWATQNAHGLYRFFFDGGLVNLSAAVFSLIAFYIASASYRAFRIRSLEATFLMIAALIVMLASVTFGTVLTSWLPNGDSPWANFRVEHVAEWLLTRVNAPAQRGILFGLEMGALAISLRLWLSLERGAYFDKEL